MKGIVLLELDTRIMLYTNKYVYHVDIVLFMDAEYAVLKTEDHLCVYYMATTGKYYPLHNIPIDLLHNLLKNYRLKKVYKRRLV